MERLKDLSKLQVCFITLLLIAAVTQYWTFGLLAVILIGIEEAVKVYGNSSESVMLEEKAILMTEVDKLRKRMAEIQTELLTKVNEVKESQEDIAVNVRSLQRKVGESDDNDII